MSMDWTDDKIATLKRMWEDGKTGGEISEVLGCSRSAVIGKAHRLDLQARRNPTLPPVDPFEQVIDFVTDFDAPLSVAAKQAGMRTDYVVMRWDRLCAAGGWQYQ